MPQLHFTHPTPTTDGQLHMEIGNPDTHVSQSLTLLTHPSHCELRSISPGVELHHCAERLRSFRISNFKYSRRCTLYDGPYRRTTVWLQYTCVLGLQKTTKGRREDYKKGGEHSRQLVNLILCELLYGLKGKQTWGRHSDWTWTLILSRLQHFKLAQPQIFVRMPTKRHVDKYKKHIYQRAVSLAPSKSLATRVGLLPRGGLRE